MTEKNRLAWIQHRREASYDFSELIEALSRMEVSWDAKDGVLAVNSSAIAVHPHAPTRLVLAPTDDGQWYAFGPGETGHLIDHLVSVAMYHMEVSQKAPSA